MHDNILSVSQAAAWCGERSLHTTAMATYGDLPSPELGSALRAVRGLRATTLRGVSARGAGSSTGAGWTGEGWL